MRVRKNSVKITDKRGTARLTPDLCTIGPGISARVDKKRKVIELFHVWNGHAPDLHMWAPHERAKVKKIHLGRLIRELGIDPKEIVGNEFKASNRNGVIKIYF